MVASRLKVAGSVYKNNEWRDRADHAMGVDRDGIEPPTHGFSVHCSTN